MIKKNGGVQPPRPNRTMKDDKSIEQINNKYKQDCKATDGPRMGLKAKFPVCIYGSRWNVNFLFLDLWKEALKAELAICTAPSFLFPLLGDSGTSLLTKTKQNQRIKMKERERKYWLENV